MKKILLIFICLTLTLTLFSNQKSKKIISNQFFYNVENLTNEFKESDSIFNGFHNAANYSSRRGTSKGDALIAGGVVTFTVSFVLCFLDNTIAASVDLITAAPETNDKVFNGVMILSSFFPIVGPVSLIAANSYWMYRWGYIYGDGLIKDAGRAVQIFFGTIFLIGEIIGLSLFILGIAMKKNLIKAFNDNKYSPIFSLISAPNDQTIAKIGLKIKL